MTTDRFSLTELPDGDVYLGEALCIYTATYNHQSPVRLSLVPTLSCPCPSASLLSHLSEHQTESFSSQELNSTTLRGRCFLTAKALYFESECKTFPLLRWPHGSLEVDDDFCFTCDKVELLKTGSSSFGHSYIRDTQMSWNKAQAEHDQTCQHQLHSILGDLEPDVPLRSFFNRYYEWIQHLNASRCMEEPSGMSHIATIAHRFQLRTATIDPHSIFKHEYSQGNQEFVVAQNVQWIKPFATETVSVIPRPDFLFLLRPFPLHGNVVIQLSIARIYWILNRRAFMLELVFADDTDNLRSEHFQFASAHQRRSFVQELTRISQQQEEKIVRSHSMNSTPLCSLQPAALAEAQRCWTEGLLSNLDYLLLLNWASGRSFSLVSQYPVMPWILAEDYASDTLPAVNERHYRAFDTPMAACNPQRLQHAQDRLNCLMEDPSLMGSPHSLFSAYYSSAAHSVFWLVRSHPAWTLAFQSGRFDVGRRQFGSIPQAWASVTGTGMDLKELIPEFFTKEGLAMLEENSQIFLPGAAHQHVELPGWAKGSVRNFLTEHRQALESVHVSAHLHQWIDLIFGFKQRGLEASKALNTFRTSDVLSDKPCEYQSIETFQGESFDIMEENDLIHLEKQQHATLPEQLFTEPHPQRHISSSELFHELSSMVLEPMALALFDIQRHL